MDKEEELETFLETVAEFAEALANVSNVNINYAIFGMAEIGRQGGKVEAAIGVKSNMPKMTDHVERLQEFLNAIGTIYDKRKMNVGNLETEIRPVSGIADRPKG